MRTTLRFMTCVGFALYLSSAPSAAQNLLLNPGFESPDTPSTQTFGVGQTIGSGWVVTATQRQVVVVDRVFAAAGGGGASWHNPSEGQQFLYLSDNVSVSTIIQTVNLTPGNYLLQFDLADFAGPFNIPGGRVLVNILNSSSASIIGGQRLFTTPNFANFTTQTLNLSVNTSDNYRLQLTSVGGHAANLDNFRLSSMPVTVPEPSALALAVTGVIGVGIVQRKRFVSKRR